MKMLFSVNDISRAVQLKKNRCLTGAEKLNHFNNHFIPASNFKFPAKQYGSHQCGFQYSWLKILMVWCTLLMMKVPIANPLCYLVNLVIDASMHLEF